MIEQICIWQKMEDGRSQLILVGTDFEYADAIKRFKDLNDNFDWKRLVVIPSDPSIIINDQIQPLIKILEK